MRLTDITIRSLKAPDQGAIIIRDDLIPGFGIRVSEGGTKSFVLTHGPRRERETLGRVGVVSLQEARTEAKRRLAEYTLGRNKPRATSWNVALEEYFVEVAANCKPRTLADYKYFLEERIRYGTTKLSDISPHDLHKSLNRFSKTPVQQQHAFMILRAFIRWAHRKHYLDINPMERMQSPHPYVPRERILTNNELKRVWHAAKEDTFGKIVKLLILTGQRRGEITGLTGAMVGKDSIMLPSSLTKNSRQHTFPLGNMAKAILNPPQPNEALFFPALGKTTPFDGWSKSKPKLDRRCGVSDWVLHDLRRTFASHLASIGIQLPVIERLLNHISGSYSGIVGVYQRYDFYPEMQEAIVRWDEHVRKLVRS